MSTVGKMPSPFDHTGLPVGLPDPVYASWVSAVRELHSSEDRAQGKVRFQFCCGYVQALQDAGALDERVARFLMVQLQDIRVDLLQNLGPRLC